MARRALALLLLLSVAAAVQSYPLLWATDALPKDVLKPLGQKLDAKTCLKCVAGVPANGRVERRLEPTASCAIFEGAASDPSRHWLAALPWLGGAASVSCC